jgi:hypothetical protein
MADKKVSEWGFRLDEKQPTRQDFFGDEVPMRFHSSEMREMQAEVKLLPWKLICPGCGRIESTLIRVSARFDFECPSEGCERHLSDYVRESVD